MEYMAMNGTWFEYDVVEKQDNVVKARYHERYVLLSQCGKETIFECYRDGRKSGQVDGNVDYANGHFRNDRLRESDGERIATMDGEKSLKVFVSDRCGGSTKVYQDENGLMYRGINTQMWSGGVIAEFVRDLTNYG